MSDDNIVSLDDIRKMQKAMNENAVEVPEVLIYRDINDLPQTIYVGDTISEQEWSRMPEETQALVEFDPEDVECELDPSLLDD